MSDHRCYVCSDCAEARYVAEGTVSGFSRDARGFLWEAGYAPDEHPGLVTQLDQAIGEGAMEAAFDVMREHGLYPHTDPRAPVHQPVADETKAAVRDAR